MVEKRIVISGVQIVDGTGKEPTPIPFDILVEGDRIIDVSASIDATGAESLNAQGLMAAPGFIDIHAHGDFDRLKHAVAEEKLRQGCTTEVFGNCGLTPFPFKEDLSNSSLGGFMTTLVGTEFEGFPTLNGFFAVLEARGIAINAASFVGQGILRAAAMGTAPEPANELEFKEMARLFEDALEDGALGLSTGLIYPPGALTGTEELTRLMSVGKQVKRNRPPLYASHIRDEGNTVDKAVDEAISIARESRAALEISHMKCLGRSNWGRSHEIIRQLEAARSSGLDVSGDVYPYTYVSTLLALILVAPEGNPETILVSNAARPSGEIWEEVVGLSVAELATEWKLSPEDAGRKVIAEAPSAIGVGEFMSEEDMLNFLKQPWTSIGSDGIEDKKGRPHPRVTGTFPRVLGRYVRDKGALTWGEAIAKMTGRPAEKLGLNQRGLLKAGYFADITLFDPEAVLDNATYKEPHLKPSGIPHVMVNGAWILKDGAVTQNLSGRVLRSGE